MLELRRGNVKASIGSAEGRLLRRRKDHRAVPPAVLGLVQGLIRSADEFLAAIARENVDVAQLFRRDAGAFTQTLSWT